MSGINRIDPTPVRLSSHLEGSRPAPQSPFVDRVQPQPEPSSFGARSGAGVAAPLVPGGAIVSAAVSSVGTLAHQGPGAAVSAQYAVTGAIPLQPGPVNPELRELYLQQKENHQAALSGMGVELGSVGGMQGELLQAQRENARLMHVQMGMQRENQVFSTVSNVLKVRHDTVKNTIQNVR
jgi:hypothetical protein